MKKAVKKSVRDRDYLVNGLTTMTSTGGSFAVPVEEYRESIVGILSVVNCKIVLKVEDKIIPLDNIEEIKKVVVKTLLKQQNETDEMGRFTTSTSNFGNGLIITWADPVSVKKV